MPDRSTILSLPYILPAQAQKHVTHNEALRLLDVIVQLSVTARDIAVPPATPAQGDRYIVPLGAQGEWSGFDRQIALYEDGAWQFFSAMAGWTAWVAGESVLASFDGSDWVSAADGPQSYGQLGISATADATNRLVVSSQATLFNHDGAGHQMKINKANGTDTASVLFQTGFSGRAEMGTAGNDDFAIKVSADGEAFVTGVSIAGATGQVTLPAALRLGGQSVDPAMPMDGMIWLNSTTGQVKVRSNGVDVILASHEAVGNSQLAPVPSGTIKGRAALGTGAPQDLTGGQVVEILPAVTSLTKGLAPASGGGTTNFLRADGTWAAPLGGGSLTSLAITATAAQINPLAAIANNHFLVADTSANFALQADDFGNPTRWLQTSSGAGVTATKTATGIDADGTPYVDYLVVGTASATASFPLYQGHATRIPAVVGQIFTTSFSAQIMTSPQPPTGCGVRADVGATEATGATTIQYTASGVAAPTLPTLLTHTNTLTAAGISTAFAMVTIVTPNGASVNYTIRIKSLQLDRAPSRQVYTYKATSPAAARVAMGVDPAGQVSMFAMNTAPAGWLKANGALVSRTTYAALFAAIGTTFGAGDGLTTFALPDLRGEFWRGWDDGRGVDLSRAFGSVQLDQMQRITGSFDGASGANMAASAAFTTGALITSNRASGTNDNRTINFDSGNSPNARVSATTVGETRPRNVALLACIKF